MVASASNGTRRPWPPRRSTARDLATAGGVVGCVALAVAGLVSPATQDLRSSIDDATPFAGRGAASRAGDVAVEIRPGARASAATSSPAVAAQPVTQLPAGALLPRLTGSVAGGAPPGGGTNRNGAPAPVTTPSNAAVGLVASASAGQLPDLDLDLSDEISSALTTSELLPVPATVATLSGSTATSAARTAGGGERRNAEATGVSKRRRPAGEVVIATSSGARAAAGVTGPRRPAAQGERGARSGRKGDAAPPQGRPDRGRPTAAGTPSLRPEAASVYSHRARVRVRP